MVVLKSVLILFLLMALGYMIGKLKVINQSSTASLSNLVLKVTLPVTVFNSTQMAYDPSMFKTMALIFCITIIFHIVSLIIGILSAKLLHISLKEKGVWLFACMCTNNGFMGLPLALSVFGNEGMFLMAIANMVSNVFIFSVGTKLLTKGYDIKEKISMRQLVYSNLNIAVIIGLICYFMQIQLPEVITQTCQYVGSATVFLSMTVVGISLSKLEIRQMFQGKTVYFLTLMRLVVIPVLTIGALHLLPKFGNSMILDVIILTACLPVASSVTIITEQYHIENELGPKIVFLSTVLCLVTIPVFMTIAL